MRPFRRLLQHSFIVVDSLFKYPFDTIILTYHSVSKECLSDLELQIEFTEFLRQIKYLQDNFSFLDIEAASSRIQERRKGPVKYISLMFDDGYIDFVENIIPLSVKYNIPVSLSPALKFILDSKNIPLKKSLSDHNVPQPLTISQLVPMASNPLITFVSHGFAHIDFSSSSFEDMNKDLNDSFSIFSDLGIRINSFCYPMGKFNNKSNKILSKSFKYLYIGPLLFFNSLPSYLIPRIPILKSDSYSSFQYRVNGRLFRDTLIIPMISKFLAAFNR